MRAWMLPAAAAAAVLLAGCGDQAEAGDVIGANADIAGPTATVPLPSGTLAVTVGEPTKELDEDLVGGQPTTVDGGRYVGVQWDFDQRIGGGAEVVVPLTGQVKAPVVWLVSDGHRYRVGSPYRVVLNGRGIQDIGLGRQYVAVEGDSDNLRLEVDYDGLTQRVDLPSGKVYATQARALEDIPTQGVRACRPAGKVDGQGLTDVPISCHANATARLPYVAGLGWAKPGHEWAVVDLSVGFGPDPPSWKRPGRPGSVQYAVFGPPEWTFTVDGRPEARTILNRDQANDPDFALRLLAFDVPVGRPATLQVRQRARLAAENVTDADFDEFPRDVTIDATSDVEI
jgi:hypothetical protein